MKKKYRLFLVLPITLLSISAINCSSNSANNSARVSFFPVQMAEHAKGPYPSALATGILVLDGGRLRLEYQGTGYSNLLIWPYGYSQYIEGEEIRIVNIEGKTVARVGDIIKVGGGEVPIVIVEKYIGKTLPEKCPGPYWLVSKVVID